MSIPTMKYREVAALFAKGGARLLRQQPASHFHWVRMVGGLEKPVIIVAHDAGSDVLRCYVEKARKSWKLRKADGVSDRDFLSGNWPPR